MKLLDLSRLCAPILIFLATVLPVQAMATTVMVESTAGNFRINLFDFDVADPDNEFTPDLKPTVDNFLAYVNEDRYDNTFFHRLSPGFVLQGGGFVYTGTMPEPQPNPPLASGESEPGLQRVELNPGIPNTPVIGQPRFSNVRGTIAMAQVGTDRDSATNQWFINLVDNGGNLDVRNGGFTAFGRVIEDGTDGGMDVVDALADFTLLAEPQNPMPDTRYSYNSPLAELPVQNYTAENFGDNIALTDANLAMITAMYVLNPDRNTEVESDLVENQLRLGFRTSPQIDTSEFSGGGNIGFIFLSMLCGLLFYRRRFR